jgi:protein TonB
MDRIVVPAPQEMVAVAEPTSAVAFALPVEGPTRVVEAAQAVPVLRQEPAAPPAVSPPVQAITYGQGEGRQPAPDYPRRAIREGQEGLVRIRFSVGEDGRVLGAEVASPSPWPLLNDAALRVVRNRWRFREGPPRLYEVAIRFELTK